MLKKIFLLVFIVLCIFPSISNGAIFQFQRAMQALYVSFDNATNGFTSTNVQAAIEEARNNAQSKARYAVSAGFDGGASTGRYLEFTANVASNQSGYVNANATWLKEISCVCQTSSTVTFTIAKVGGADLATCVITASRKGTRTGLTVPVVSLDELSVRVTSGSCSRPITWLFFQNQ